MTIHELNILPEPEFKLQLLNCCGSTAWVNKIHELIPYEDLVELLTAAEEYWYQCSETDWLQALKSKATWIDVDALKNDAVQQPLVAEETTPMLGKKKDEYEKKFGFNFIVFGIDKSADEVLNILQQRLQNSREEEMKIAAAEQNRITQLRIQKLLA